MAMGSGDGGGQDLGEDDQLDVDGERLRDDAHGRLMGGEGLAQVALEDVADPDEVLLPERLVETELMVEDRRVLRGVVRPEDGDGGVARQQVDQEEGGHRHEEDDDDEEDGAFGHVPAHPGAPLPLPAVDMCSLRRTSLDPVPYHAPHV